MCALKRVDRYRTNSDMISDLPLDVLETILVKLPLKEAARTCVLSKNWRYNWTCMSEIVINNKCYSKVAWYVHRWGLIQPIFLWVRKNHQGPISKFKLDAHYFPKGSDLEQWFKFLAEKDIKEITIRNHVDPTSSNFRLHYSIQSPGRLWYFSGYFDLPSSIFSSAKLSHLEVYGCFRIPSLFNVSCSLKTLELNQVSINSETLEGLLRSCVSLERLILLNINHLGFPRIHSQTLNFLKICSKFEDICLEGCPGLTDVDIGKLVHDIPISRQFEQGKPSNLSRILGCLSNSLKKLTLSRYFPQFLGNGDLIRSPLIAFSHLMVLEINDMKYSSPEDFAATLVLLQSSPNLEELYISNANSHDLHLYQYLEMTTGRSSFPLNNYLETESFSGIMFDRLKLAKFTGFQESRFEWKFLQIVLDRSPDLENMFIVSSRSVKTKQIPESQVVRYEKASQKALKISKTN